MAPQKRRGTMLDAVKAVAGQLGPGGLYGSAQRVYKGMETAKRIWNKYRGEQRNGTSMNGRYKRIRTNTAIRRSKPKVENYVKEPNGAVSKSFSKYYKKASPNYGIIRKMTKLDVREEDGVQGTYSAFGRQGVQIIGRVANMATLQDMYQQGIKTTAAEQAAAIGSVANRDCDFYLEGCQEQYLITNPSPTTVEACIYEIVVKNICDFEPVAAWTVSLNQSKGDANVMPDLQARWGTKPEQGEWFKKNFKVIKKTHIVLRPGSTHQHNIKSLYNQKIDLAQLYGYGTLPVINMPRTTKYIMLVTNGMPTDAALDANTWADITLAQTKITIVYRHKYYYRCPKMKPKNVYHVATTLDQTPVAAYAQEPDGDIVDANLDPQYG